MNFMHNLCRASIEELENDPPTPLYDEMEYIREMEQKHRELTVLLLTGYEDRLQEYLEDKYQDFADLVDAGGARVMDFYLSGNLSDKVMDLVEKEASILASVMMG